MFYFKEDDKEYRVKFVHERKLFVRFVKNKKYETIEYNAPYKTTCLIIDVDTKKVAVKGVAICSDEDQFNYRSGRILSLERATKNLTKDIKKQIWNTFFSISKSR